MDHTKDLQIPWYPPNVELRRVFVGEEGIAICGACLYRFAYGKLNVWNNRWRMSDVAKEFNFEEITGTGEGWCSECEREVN